MLRAVGCLRTTTATIPRTAQVGFESVLLLGIKLLIGEGGQGPVYPSISEGTLSKVPLNLCLVYLPRSTGKPLNMNAYDRHHYVKLTPLPHLTLLVSISSGHVP